MTDVVIVSARRSPMGRANKGQFMWTRADDLCAEVVRACLAEVGAYGNTPVLNLADTGDFLVGWPRPDGEQGMNVARNIAFLAGLPNSVPAVTVNRFCSSSLVTIMMAAQGILCGHGDVYLSAGVESMSHVPMGGFNPSLNPRLMKEGASQAYISMGITAENLAKKYKIDRKEQEEFSLQSHQKALKAQTQGLFKDEIVSCKAVQKDGSAKIVDTDEGPRETSLEKLAALQPAFLENGTVTAGTSSPLTDGVSATLLMSADKAKKLGLKPLAKILSFAVTGCEPEIMGIAPVGAVKKALKRANLKLDQIDIIELNEAFAAQSLAVIKDLEIDQKKLNPKGGAIALGHPLGATGGRMVATLVHGLKQFDKKYGLETMCVGGGQGAAMIVERLLD